MRIDIGFWAGLIVEDRPIMEMTDPSAVG